MASHLGEDSPIRAPQTGEGLEATPTLQVARTPRSIITQSQSSLLFPSFDGGQVTLEEFRAHLRTLGKDEQYETLCGVAHHYSEISEQADEVGAILTALVESFGFEERMQQDVDTWETVKQASDRSHENAKKKASAIQTLQSVWGQANLSEVPELYRMSNTSLKKVISLTKVARDHKHPWSDVKKALLKAQAYRIANPSKGTSNVITVQPLDADRAKEYLTLGVSLAVSRNELLQINKGRNQYGLICELADDVGDIGSPSLTEEEDIQPVAERRTRGKRSLSGKGIEEDEELAGEEVDNRATAVDERYRRGGEDFDVDYQDEGGYADDEEEDAEGSRRKRRKIERATYPCGCTASIPSAFLTQIKADYRPNDIAKSALIKKWKQHIADDPLNLCFMHTRRIVSALGMTTVHEQATLHHRLGRYYEANESSELGKLKTDHDTFMWFRKTHRPAHPSDTLGPYRFFPTTDISKFAITSAEQLGICEYLGIPHKEWEKRGSVGVPLFRWWKDYEYEGQSIYDIALEEFSMYRHHQREIGGRKNFGWLRTMFHGLCQQAMRQDPVYYMAYCALRADQCTNLISYPYYAKYQEKGDNTAFRHIDLQITTLVSHGRGANQIQGSLSLDDEYTDDCTIILPGMHKNLSSWYDRLRERAKTVPSEIKIEGLVNDIKPAMFDDDDKKFFGTDWTPVPCGALEVRITQPHLPHGAQPSQRTRRTMLPWYVALQEDLHTLEVIEAGNYDDLSKAHRDLASGPRTPSGLSNRYGDIPGAFPAAVALTGLGPVSDALVCRVRYSHPTVIADKMLLLRGSNRERDAYISVWRKKAVEQVVRSWKLVQKYEEAAFGEKSYFRCKRMRRHQPPPDAIPEDDEYVPARHGAEDEEV